MDIEILAGLISFATLILVWAFAPSTPTTEKMSVPATAPKEALAS